MNTPHETNLGKGLSTTHYDKFPTVELHDENGTMYIPQKCWKKLIEVLEKATTEHEKFQEEKLKEKSSNDE